MGAISGMDCSEAKRSGEKRSRVERLGIVSRVDAERGGAKQSPPQGIAAK